MTENEATRAWAGRGIWAVLPINCSYFARIDSLKGSGAVRLNLRRSRPIFVIGILHVPFGGAQHTTNMNYCGHSLR
jgi:hypothetical protein